HRERTVTGASGSGDRVEPVPAPVTFLGGGAPRAGASAVLDGGLERAAGRELRHARRRNVNLLGRVAGIDAGACGALLRLELAESGEGHVAARLERVGDGLQERVDRFARVARRELAPSSHLRDELLLGHVPLLLSRSVARAGTTLPGWELRLNDAIAVREQLAGAEDRPQPDGLPCERVGAALLAVDDAHRCVHDEAHGTQGFDRIEQGAARRDDVFDEADALALVVRALDALASAVLLRLLADDHERQPGLERRG